MKITGTYKVYELDMETDKEYVIDQGLNFTDAIAYVRSHPEGKPRRIEPE